MFLDNGRCRCVSSSNIGCDKDKSDITTHTTLHLDRHQDHGVQVQPLVSASSLEIQLYEQRNPAPQLSLQRPRKLLLGLPGTAHNLHTRIYTHSRRRRLQGCTVGEPPHLWPCSYSSPNTNQVWLVNKDTGLLQSKTHPNSCLAAMGSDEGAATVMYTSNASARAHTHTQFDLIAPHLK